MLRTAHITLTSVGIDTGPYNIYVIDSGGITTLVASNIAQSTLLTTGYDINVADNIVTVRVESVNPTCSETPLNISVPSSRSRVNVRDYGAVGNGVHNDTVAIQTAIDENEYIYIPEGNYLVDTITLKTNTNILGEGMGKSQLTRRYVVSSINPFNCLMLATSDSPETTVSNITLNGLTLYGESDIHGFSEFVHLLYLVGTDNVTVTNCEFKAFRGDGIDLGGVDLYDINRDPRHNSNVTISNCVFDGVNKENRNGVSVIDGSDVLIDSCEFKNTTKSNMPGAIDFETDDSFNIVRNIIVTNSTFTNIGGNAGVIGISLDNLSYDIFPNNFTIENNTITNCTNTDGTLFYLFKKYDGSPVGTMQGQSNVTWKNNTISNCQKSFLINGANGLTMEDCIFTDITDFGYIPYPVQTYTNSRNVNILNCTFDNCGSTSGNAIGISNVNNLIFDRNQFIDCGNGTINSSALYFFFGEGYNITITNNIFSTPDEKTARAIKADPSYIFHSATNEFYGNTLNGLPYTFPTS